MFKNFTRLLSAPVGNNLENIPKDVESLKHKFKAIDVYELPVENGYIDRELDNAIFKFQKDKDLKIDGKVNPGGETERSLLEELGKRNALSAAESGQVGKQQEEDIVRNWVRLDNKEKLSEKEESVNSRSLEFDAVGRMVRSQPEEKSSGEIPEEKSRVLFAPTFDVVDKEKVQKILKFDPNKGGGDFHSALKYGLEPNGIARKAEKEAQKFFPKQKGFEDDSDAFRHALGSYMMTKRYGSKAAKQILDRHERSPKGGLSPRDTEMGLLQDLYNNKVGRDAALDFKNKGRNPVDVIKELYKERKLQTRPFRLKRR